MPEESKKTEEAAKEAKAADAPKDSATADSAEAPKKKVKKRKVRRLVPHGFAHIKAGFNNTLVTITDPECRTICWASSGASGFKGTRKSTPYAAQVAAKNAAEKAKEFGVETVDVFVKGIGPGREQAVRGLSSAGIEVGSITDRTPTPHGGCRKRRPRRV